MPPLFVYYSAIYLLIAISFGLSFLHLRSPKEYKHPVMLFASLLVLLVISRLPILTTLLEANPDEAQMVAQAILAKHFWIPWTQMDTTTSGPLNTWVLMTPYLYGSWPDYFSARVLAIILQWGSAVSCYYCLFFAYRNKQAILGSVLAVFYWCFYSDIELHFYSSELLPIFLISIGMLFLSYAIADENRPQTKKLYLGIACLSLVPFAKLQAAPLAIAICGWGCFMFIFAHRKHAKLSLLPGILFSGLAGPLLILLPVVLSGGFHDFLYSYILFALEYGGKPTVRLMERLLKPSSLLLCSSMAALLCLLIWQAIAEIGGRNKWNLQIAHNPLTSFRDYTFTALLTLYFMGALVIVVKPGNIFPHYINFLVIPSAIMLSLLCIALNRGGLKKTSALLSLFLVLLISIPNLIRLPDSKLMRFATNPIPYSLHQHHVVKMINRLKNDDDRVTVWGWKADIYVRTKLASGTREVVAYDVNPSTRERTVLFNWSEELNQYFKERFLSDLKTNKPRFFVDACSSDSFFFNERKYGPESLPEVFDYLTTNYTLVLDTTTIKSTGMRLWVRNSQ